MRFQSLYLFVSLAVFLCTLSPVGSAKPPMVTSAELQARTEELQMLAAAFNRDQLERVKVIAERLMQFMPKADQRQLRAVSFEIKPDPSVNAYVRGSHMTICYGLLKFVQSDHELAAVIGHELAHIAKGHYAQNAIDERNAIQQAEKIIRNKLIVTQQTKKRAIETYGQVKGELSREREREADYYGYKYIYLAGFDLRLGTRLWERMAVELPGTLNSDLFASHPPSPERLIRAEKTLELLTKEGLVPFALATSRIHDSKGLKETKRGEGSQSFDEGVQAAEAEALRVEVEKLKAEIKARDSEFYETQLQKAETERVLSQANEGARRLRYAEFGVKQMGLAKKVTNLLIAKTVAGENKVFPLKQGRVEWYAQYDYTTKNSLLAFVKTHRKYHVQWFSPNGRLYSEKDFLQSQVRVEFAKTVLEWDVELGDYLVGEWLVRVFENGQLLDERSFEIVKA